MPRHSENQPDGRGACLRERLHGMTGDSADERTRVRTGEPVIYQALGRLRADGGKAAEQ
jgi:hypothetical protein